MRLSFCYVRGCGVPTDVFLLAYVTGQFLDISHRVSVFFIMPDTITYNRYTNVYSISVSMVSRLTLNLRQLGTRDQSTLIPRSSTAITGSNFTTQIILTEYEEDAFDNAEEEDSRHLWVASRNPLTNSNALITTYKEQWCIPGDSLQILWTIFNICRMVVIA